MLRAKPAKVLRKFWPYHGPVMDIPQKEIDDADAEMKALGYVVYAGQVWPYYTEGYRFTYVREYVQEEGE